MLESSKETVRSSWKQWHEEAHNSYCNDGAGFFVDREWRRRWFRANFKYTTKWMQWQWYIFPFKAFSYEAKRKKFCKAVYGRNSAQLQRRGVSKTFPDIEATLWKPMRSVFKLGNVQKNALRQKATQIPKATKLITV